MKANQDLFICQCASCEHLWVERLTLPMSMTAFSSRLKGMNCCPECSGTKCGILLGPKFEEAKKVLVAKGVL